MVQDAGFEDGGDAPLRLKAEGEGDLPILSALVQDAVGKVANVKYAPGRRRFSLLLYRFRWEDREKAKRERRDAERVATALTVNDVLGAKVSGLDPHNGEAVINLLSLAFETGEDGAGVLTIACSGGATIRLHVECLDIALVDLTQPWKAGAQPRHED